MENLMTGHATNDLKAAFASLQSDQPNIRIRDAAKRLDVSEAELLQTQLDGTLTPLHGPWGDLIKELPSLGAVMTLTRNEFAVHEKVGVYENVEIYGPMGLVLGADIDLRLFLERWTFGFAVEKPIKNGTRRSLQFFDAHGGAIQKIFLREDSNLDAYRELVTAFSGDGASNAPLNIVDRPANDPDRPDDQIDVAGLCKDWAALQDTHDFIKLLKKFSVGRVQALRLVGDDFAYPVAAGSFRTCLEEAQASGLDIMVFVGNQGCIQIHTGPVHKTKPMGDWFNVLDPDFNLHLLETGIDSAWVVRKPTEDGDVTSLEIYDAHGESIAYMFGKRKPGDPELEGWRDLTATLPKLARSHAADENGHAHG